MNSVDDALLAVNTGYEKRFLRSITANISNDSGLGFSHLALTKEEVSKAITIIIEYTFDARNAYSTSSSNQIVLKSYLVQDVNYPFLFIVLDHNKFTDIRDGIATFPVNGYYRVIRYHQNNSDEYRFFTMNYDRDAQYNTKQNLHISTSIYQNSSYFAGNALFTANIYAVMEKGA